MRAAPGTPPDGVLEIITCGCRLVEYLITIKVEEPMNLGIRKVEFWRLVWHVTWTRVLVCSAGSGARELEGEERIRTTWAEFICVIYFSNF